MARLSILGLVVVLCSTAHAQFGPPLPLPAPPIYYAPRYYPPPPPVYVPPYARPINLDYARKARIYRGVGIPLLSVGVPAAVAGGIVWIVGAACDRCSPNVSYTGIGLLAGGAGLFIPGAILLGVGNYYGWLARFTARIDLNLALGPDRAGATATIRF